MAAKVATIEKRSFQAFMRLTYSNSLSLGAYNFYAITHHIQA
jgi:hypothetical protein